MPIIVVRTLYGEVIGKSKESIEEIDADEMDFIELDEPRLLTTLPTPQGMMSGFDHVAHLMSVKTLAIPFVHIIVYGAPHERAEAGYMQTVSNLVVAKSSIITASR